MLEINVDRLRKNIDVLNSLIKQYEEIQLNLFAQLKESCEHWQDGSSVEYDRNMYLEKNEANLVIDMLKNKKEIYHLVSDKYSQFGKTIRCNLNNKETVLNNLDHCTNQTTIIMNQLSNIDNSFYYSEYQIIMSQKRKMLEVKKELIEIRREITNLYSKIELIEQEIRAKISELEEIKVNSFEFKLG